MKMTSHPNVVDLKAFFYTQVKKKKTFKLSGPGETAELSFRSTDPSTSD